MKIGISALFYASGGSLTNLTQLLDEWQRAGELARDEVTIFASSASAAALRKSVRPEALARVTFVEFAKSGRGLLHRLIDEQWHLPRRLKEHAIDVLFCPGNVMPFRTGVPVVATFQNAAPFCESVTLRDSGFRWYTQFALLGAFMRETAKRATAVVFLSRYFRDLFVQRFGFDARRGYVVPRACSTAEVQPDAELEARLGVRRPFVLSVSHLNPYKNVLELIEAFARASRDVPGRQLVLAGRAQFPGYTERINAAIARSGLGPDQLLLTGEIPHRDTLTLMRSCESFAFTSTCENFPTALVEALALGAPVASSNVGVMPEVTGEAALLFDPFDVDAIAAALRRLMTDGALRATLAARGVARAAELPSRQSVAQMTLTALRTAGGHAPPGEPSHEPKRIVIVSCVYPPEPVVSSRTSADLADLLRDAGHQVTVICPFPSRPGGRIYSGFRRRWRARSVERGIETIRTFATVSRSSTLLSRFTENISFALTSALALRRVDADVVYINSWPVFGAGAAALAARMKRVPYVVTVQDVYPESLSAQKRPGASLLRTILRKLDAGIAHKASAVVVLSEAFASIYRENRKVPAERVHIVPNWLPDTAVQDAAHESHDYRRSLGLSDDDFLVVYGGNIGVAAAVERVIEAFRTIGDPRIHLLIAGDGSRADACEALAREVSPRIRFHRPWPDAETSRVLGAADVLALPTLQGQSLTSVPSKLISYFLAARPVLAAAAPESEVARTVVAARAGWVVEGEGIAEAIARAAATPREERRAMGERARAYAVEHFGRDACAKRVIDLLRAAAS